MTPFLGFGKGTATDRCPPDWMLTRHVSGEPSEAWLETHVERCPRCAAECASLGLVVSQVRQEVRASTLRPAARRAIAMRLLTTGSDAKVGWVWRRALVGGAMVALVTAVVVMASRGERRPPRPTGVAATKPVEAPHHDEVERTDPHGGSRLETHAGAAPVAPAGGPRQSRATVRAIGAARFERIQAPPDDVVYLDHGSIVLAVAPLAPGERFRVRTDDGEVEVRGTQFKVSALRGKLTAVSVSSGRVEVRSPGGGRVLLEPGDEWVRGSDKPAEARSFTPPRAGATAEAPPRLLTKSTPFVRAWSLLRQGDAREAAALFGEVERSASDLGIAEDALYWRAVATTKAGDRQQAQALFERFSQRFPSSPRAGEAAAALGWLYLEGGQVAEARRAFGLANQDSSAAVRDGARDGLRRAAEP